MTVQCPACKTTFLAPSEALGGLGRCSKCHHEFTMTSQNTRIPMNSTKVSKLEWTQCHHCLAPFPVDIGELSKTVGCRSCGEVFVAERWNPSSTQRLKTLKRTRNWNKLKDHVRHERKRGHSPSQIENALIDSGLIPEMAQNVVNAVLTEDSHFMLKAVKVPPKAEKPWINSFFFAAFGVLCGLFLATGQVQAAPDAVESVRYFGLIAILCSLVIGLNGVAQYKERLRPSN